MFIKHEMRANLPCVSVDLPSVGLDIQDSFLAEGSHQDRRADSLRDQGDL